MAAVLDDDRPVRVVLDEGQRVRQDFCGQCVLFEVLKWAGGAAPDTRQGRKEGLQLEMVLKPVC